MEKYIINGGKELYGSIEVQTAKNSVLPILAATVLTDDKVRVLNVPNNRRKKYGKNSVATWL